MSWLPPSRSSLRGVQHTVVRVQSTEAVLMIREVEGIFDRCCRSGIYCMVYGALRENTAAHMF